MRSCDKLIIYLFYHNSYGQNGRMVTQNQGFPLIKLHDRGFARSRDDLNTLYLYLHKTKLPPINAEAFKDAVK